MDGGSVFIRCYREYRLLSIRERNESKQKQLNKMNNVRLFLFSFLMDVLTRIDAKFKQNQQ